MKDAITKDLTLSPLYQAPCIDEKDLDQRCLKVYTSKCTLRRPL
jgi:hypothetical protein